MPIPLDFYCESVIVELSPQTSSNERAAMLPALAFTVSSYVNHDSSLSTWNLFLSPVSNWPIAEIQYYPAWGIENEESYLTNLRTSAQYELSSGYELDNSF